MGLIEILSIFNIKGNYPLTPLCFRWHNSYAKYYLGGCVIAISGDKYTFTQENVDKSPTDGGVYALYDGDETIYIGKGDGVNGIRERLQAHKRGDEGACTKNASHYRREVCSNPTTREGQELEAHKKANGKLPRCNDVMP